MDPTTALTQLRHPDTNAADRFDLAVDLAHWLRHGGFVPAGEMRDDLLDELNQITRPPTQGDDAHLEAAYEDRTDMGGRLVNTTPIHVVATARVVDWAGDQPNRHAFLPTCISRHHRRDWGDLDHHDWELNDRAVACRSGRLLSAYVVPPELDPVDAQLWIITDDIEDPDTITTLLWPTDY